VSSSPDARKGIPLGRLERGRQNGREGEWREREEVLDVSSNQVSAASKYPPGALSLRKSPPFLLSSEVARYSPPQKPLQNSCRKKRDLKMAFPEPTFSVVEAAAAAALEAAAAHKSISRARLFFPALSLRPQRESGERAHRLN